MNITITRNDLKALLLSQIQNNFLLTNDDENVLSDSIISAALSRIEICFAENLNKYYRDDNGELLFNPYHSGQYTIFLYFLSKEVWKLGNSVLADKIYYLNRMMNSCDLFYQVDMPDIFHLDHPLGSVIGRGTFKDYFLFQQNCTVGNNGGIFPIFGEFVWLFAYATVIGDTTIGNNVFVSAGTFIKDEQIPDNSIVFGQSPNLIIKEKPPEYFYAKSPFKNHKRLL